MGKKGADIGGHCLSVQPRARRRAAQRTGGDLTGLDDQASLFNLFFDCHPVQNPCPGHAQVSDVSSPSEDNDALKIDYQSGNPSYMGVYAYIRLGNDDAATRYQINYDFYFPNRGPIQALEFPMNNYIQNKCTTWASSSTERRIP